MLSPSSPPPWDRNSGDGRAWPPGCTRAPGRSSGRARAPCAPWYSWASSRSRGSARPPGPGTGVGELLALGLAHRPEGGCEDERNPEGEPSPEDLARTHLRLLGHPAHGEPVEPPRS